MRFSMSCGLVGGVKRVKGQFNSFYEMINKQEGFLALQAYFVKASLLLDRETLHDQGPQDVNYMSSHGYQSVPL